MRSSDWSSDVCSSDLVVHSCLGNLLRRAVVDEDGLSPPTHRDALTQLNRAQIDLDGGLRENVRCRVHAVDQGPQHGARAYGRHRAGRQIEKVTARFAARLVAVAGSRSEEHTSELQSLMRISYEVFCLKKQRRRTPFKEIEMTSNTI